MFGPVGEWISRGYGNVVSYFNAFYNAKRLFQEAEEEIRTAELVARGKSPSSSHTITIPQTARQKLSTVIEKSSHILSLYPESAYVEDALLLIGKSYHYQAEYLKAERKFTELLAQFPTSSLRFEGQLWLTRTLDKLNKDDDALKVGELLAAEAVQFEKRDIAGEVFALMGDIEKDRDQLPQSIEHYRKAVEVSRDDLLRASTQAKIGDVFLGLQRFEEAAAAYLKAIDFEYDTYLEQYCKIQAALCYRQLKRYDVALSLIDALLYDFRFREYFANANYEYARTLRESGRIQEAMHEYKHVDSTYARTEFGAKSAFELGQLLESETGDYKEALLEYSRAAAAGSSEFALQARKRERALVQYFQLHARLSILDSLLTAPVEVHSEDSKSESANGSLDRLPTSSIENPPVDSVRVEADSLHTILGDSVESKPPPLNKDSLRVVYSNVCYQLGEVFFSELEIPDSAFHWLKESFTIHVDSSTAPRILFVLADIARRDADKRYGEPADFYRELVGSYPQSTYAEEARARLGILTETKNESDPAEKVYTQAEKMIEAGQFRRALDLLAQVAAKYPTSKYAPKSQYAIGWLYENRLSAPDSALKVYKSLVEHHALTPYAAAVKSRVGAESKPAAPDSINVSRPDPQTEPKGTKEDSAKSPQLERDRQVEKADSTGRRAKTRPVD